MDNPKSKRRFVVINRSKDGKEIDLEKTFVDVGTTSEICKSLEIDDERALSILSAVCGGGGNNASFALCKRETVNG